MTMLCLRSPTEAPSANKHNRITDARKKPDFGRSAEQTCAADHDDAAQTTLVLVTRPGHSSIREAERTSIESEALGLRNQFLILNGVFRAIDHADPVAAALEKRGAEALAAMP